MLPFVPGTETAGGRARRVKNNEQVSQKAEERKALHEIVIGALMRNKEFNRAALPKRIRPPLISRYREGMAYGQHVDNALMGPKQARERSDVSITVFISDINEYDGGELVIHGSFGIQEVKLPSGSRRRLPLLQPARGRGSHARRAPGRRHLGAILRARRSAARDPGASLAQVKDKMNTIAADAIETDLVHHTYANLLRMWAET